MGQLRDKMTKLIFRDGLRTIGGTLVEVIDGKERIIFDFGTSFSGTNEEVLPDIPDLYSGDSEFNNLVLISHLHLDHTKAMNHIHLSIPVVMNNYSSEFLNDLYKIGFDQIKGQPRHYDEIKNKETINFGNFKITNLLVDHDVLGASAFLIETPDLKLFYSGDIRLHGRNDKYTYEMIEYIKSLPDKIDVAIFEGVTISFIDDDYDIIASKEVSNNDKEVNFPKLVSETIDEDIILVNPYVMGLERLQSIFELANNLSKEVVLTSEFGYLANKYLSEYNFKLLENDKFNLGKEVVGYGDISSKYITIFDYQNKEKYKTFKEKACLLQTGGEPLGDFDYRWEDFLKYCEEKNLNMYKIGSGGHASPENLLYIIEEINPEILMPLHSFKPELVKSKNIGNVLPIKDKEYIFIDHKLKKD